LAYLYDIINTCLKEDHPYIILTNLKEVCIVELDQAERYLT